MNAKAMTGVEIRRWLTEGRQPNGNPYLERVKYNRTGNLGKYKLTCDQQKNLCEEFLAGASQVTLSRKYKVSESYVHDVLKRRVKNIVAVNF